MSTDRELLELAAKALGWRFVSYSERRSTGVVDGGMALVVADGRTFGWSPLHNDGDALRLAVKLRFNVDCMTDLSTEVTWAHEESFRSEEQDYTDDRAASVRRAIVRAAAQIGKAQP